MTVEEARRLLGLAVIPPGSVEIATSVVSVPQALGTPMDKSLVEKTKQWQVPMAFDDAVEWVRSHPPASLHAGGGSRGSGPGAQRTAGYSYLAPDSAAWIDAELDISIVTNGSGKTYIRADGKALWLDPTPVSDRGRGPRMRLTVAGGCPESDANAHGVTNDGADLDSRLLPSGAPTAALVCRYAGLNRAAFSLVAHRTLDGGQAAQLAGVINRIRLTHTAGGSRSCPMDDGSAEILAFSYPGRSDVAIWYAATGCRFVANGHIVASALDLPSAEALAGG